MGIVIWGFVCLAALAASLAGGVFAPGPLLSIMSWVIIKEEGGLVTPPFYYVVGNY